MQKDLNSGISAAELSKELITTARPVEFSGTTRIVGGTAIFNLPTATTVGYEHNTGTFDGNGIFSITGAAVYERGDIRGSGTTRVESTGSLSLTSFETMHLTGRRFDCFADTIWTGADISLRIQDGAIFNNHGMFDMRADTILDGSGTGIAFHNFGTFKKTAGTGESRLFGVAFTNSGTIHSDSGVLRFNVPFRQVTGSVLLSSGSLHWDQPLILDGGGLIGSGTLVGDVVNNAGTIRPGAPLGVISITGSYQQAANGTLAIDVGGTTAGTQFDRVQITGTATLAGALSSTLANGFTPTLSDTFEVITASSVTGAFTSLSGSFGEGLIPVATYGAGTVTIGIVNALPVVDLGTLTTAGSGLSFRITGITGQTYVVQGSQDFRNWSDVETRLLTVTEWDFSEMNPVTPHRFYRVGLLRP
ncbi:MAG: hypothetical protein ACPGVU_07130 [Limisphaerales bacterium]